MVCQAAALFWRVALPLILIRKVDRVGRAQYAIELLVCARGILRLQIDFD